MALHSSSIYSKSRALALAGADGFGLAKKERMSISAAAAAPRPRRPRRGRPDCLSLAIARNGQARAILRDVPTSKCDLGKIVKRTLSPGDQAFETGIIFVDFFCVWVSIKREIVWIAIPALRGNMCDARDDFDTIIVAMRRTEIKSQIILVLVSISMLVPCIQGIVPSPRRPLPRSIRAALPQGVRACRVPCVLHCTGTSAAPARRRCPAR
eukprot:162902-Pleurochrysis_carterae.AAC.2